MRKLDFAVQTVLFGITLASALAGVLIEMGFMLFGGITMFLIGVCQLLSAAATSINRTHGNVVRTKMIRIYWIVVLVYFLVLGVLFFSRQENLSTIWFFVAWGIAIYYYVFTIKLAFPKIKDRKNYMDVIN